MNSLITIRLLTSYEGELNRGEQTQAEIRTILNSMMMTDYLQAMNDKGMEWNRHRDKYYSELLTIGPLTSYK